VGLMCRVAQKGGVVMPGGTAPLARKNEKISASAGLTKEVQKKKKVGETLNQTKGQKKGWRVCGPAKEDAHRTTLGQNLTCGVEAKRGYK